MSTSAQPIELFRATSITIVAFSRHNFFQAWIRRKDFRCIYLHGELRKRCVAAKYDGNEAYFPLGGNSSRKIFLSLQARFRLKVEWVSTFERRRFSANQSDGLEKSMRAEYSA